MIRVIIFTYSKWAWTKLPKEYHCNIKTESRMCHFIWKKSESSQVLILIKIRTTVKRKLKILFGENTIYIIQIFYINIIILLILFVILLVSTRKHQLKACLRTHSPISFVSTRKHQLEECLQHTALLLKKY